MKRYTPRKRGLVIYLIIQTSLSVHRPMDIAPSLQQAIDDCSSLEELYQLLLSLKTTKDEAIINAFDRRIDELEQSALHRIS